MKKISKRELRLYTTFFLNGVIMNIITIGLPLILSAKKLDNADIAAIIGISFLGSFFQPLVGTISDSIKHPKYLVSICSLVLTITTLTMFFTDSTLILKIMVLFSSIAMNSAYGIIDSIVSIICHRHNYNYGFVRSGMSFGYGMGIMLGIPFVLFGDTSLLLTLAAALGITSAIFSLKIDDSVKEKSEAHYITEVKYVLKNKTFILVLITTVLFASLTAIKLSYQTIKLEEINASYIAIALISFILILPEMVLMPKYHKYFQKFTFTKSLIISAIILIAHLLVLNLSSSTWLIMLSAPLHGIAAAICLPKMTEAFRTILPVSIISTGFLLRNTFTALAGYLLSIIIIESVFTNYGVNSVFLTLAALSITIIIFALLLKLQIKNKEVKI